MRKIGMIEDNSELVRLITDYMNQTGRYTVTWATKDGDEGLRLVSEDPVDLILLDLVIPGNDGLYVLEKLSEIPDRPACIVFSGMGQESVMRQAADRGADYFLLKPVYFDVLVRRIDDVLEGRSRMVRPTLSEVTKQTKDPESFAREVLNNLDIPRTLGGHNYLKSAVRLASEDSGYLTGGITKRLYPAIAKEFSITSHQVERGIRHALVRTWQRNKGRNYNLLLGHGNTECLKPTNGEFISALVDLYLHRR